MDAAEQEYATANGTAWCATCGRRVAVADDYASDTGDRFTQVRAFRARPLYCGHDDSSPQTVVGRASDDQQTVNALVQAQTQARVRATAAHAERHGDL